MALTVNGEHIDEAALAREAESLRQRFSQLSEQERSTYGLDPDAIEKRAIEWAQENVIEQTLLRQEAVKNDAPLPEDAVEKAFQDVVKRYGGEDKLKEAELDEQQVRDDIATRLKVDRLIGSVTSKSKPPRPKEVAEFYRKNKERFKTPETVHASHIVKHIEKDVSEEQAKEAIDKLYAEMQDGRSFEELADQQSDCPGNGGDLGYFAAGQMVQEFEDVVFAMEVGETSAVFQTVFGFHIAKLLDRRPEGLRPLKDVEADIRKEILNERQTKALEVLVDSLREKASVTGNTVTGNTVTGNTVTGEASINVTSTTGVSGR